MLRELLTWLGFGLLSLSWFVTLFLPQVSSPNYRSLFFGILPFAVLHLTLAIFIFMRAPVWGKGCIAVLSSLALLSFLDLTMRVWLHFGLLSWLLQGVI
ncbi:hypothetical protein [Prosthecobacter sp.]|uniref:hypothetical protein n=1 Tax=Prosthecobacter sp. TaxID=1965333 RepID=UPI003784EB27